jgi:hypothetical protein
MRNMDDKIKFAKAVIRRVMVMRSSYVRTTGMIPNTVTMHPDAFFALRLMRKRYLGKDVNDTCENPTIFGMKLIESYNIKEDEIHVGRTIKWKFKTCDE